MQQQKTAAEVRHCAGTSPAVPHAHCSCMGRAQRSTYKGAGRSWGKSHKPIQHVAALLLQVMDEPLYASFLSITGLARPYRDLVLQAQVGPTLIRISWGGGYRTRWSGVGVPCLVECVFGGGGWLARRAQEGGMRATGGWCCRHR
jgi:hypothetical protein